MGDRCCVRLQVAEPVVEFSGVGLESCSKDSGESREAPDAKLLVDREDANPARCSASSSERKELENGRWTSLERRDDAVTASFGNLVGSSFRSEDSEVLALWEEKSEKYSPKVVSKDLSWLKPSVEPTYSPWLESVSNAVKKIESFSHAFSRSSPVHPKGDVATFGSPSLEYLKSTGGGRSSSRRDFKIVSSPARSSTETVLHNSPKARYSNASLCRVVNRNYDQLESSGQSPASSSTKLRHAVSCGPELQFGSSAGARGPVDVSFTSRIGDDKGQRSPWRDSNHEKRTQRNDSVSGLSCSQSPFQPERLSNQASSKPKLSVETVGKPCEVPTSRIYPLNLHIEVEGTGNARQCTIAAASGRQLSQQSHMKISVEAVSSSMDRCSSINPARSQSMDEAMINVYASGADVTAQQARAPTLHSQVSGERKPSHRYYQRVTSRERSSRWSSCDDTPLDHIDFVAPSAARFLEDEACVSPVKSPIKAAGAVPFTWEKEPGKPKDNSRSAAESAQLQSTLQLPPRLAPRKQCPSPLRNRYINKSMSAPLAELYPLPRPKSSSWESESTKVHLPWPEVPTSATEETGKDSCPASNSERGACRSASIDPPITKSSSARDIRSASRQTLSRLSAGGDAGDQGPGAQCPRSTNDTLQLDHERKPAHHNSGVVRPASPTSILCGPGDGSHPSSNPSLSSEHDAPQTSATAASAPFHSIVASCASFDSLEHTMEHSSSELMSPESSLTSPLRSNTRCNSMSYNHDFDHMSNYFQSTDCQKGASRIESAFVKFCKTGKRWVKTKAHPKLGTIYSPEVWTPGITLQFQSGANSDFSSRLGRSSTSKIDHSHVQIKTRRFAPSASALPYEDIGDRSPAYAATLELLSPIERFSSKKTSRNRQAKPPPRPTRKTTSRLRVRARVRARFFVPMRRVLRTLISRCTFRRRNKHVKAAESVKPLYHVDYTLCQANI